jgi:succinate dehydrogenase hydrophobic anchor subunit
MELLLLNILIVLPVAAWYITRRSFPLHTWATTGTSFGAVISPLSMGLYATFFASPWGLVTGLLGLVSVMIHGAVGYNVAIYLGLIQSHTVVSGLQQHIYIEFINAIAWGAVYGLMGWGIDSRLSRRRHSKTNAN